MVKDLGGLLLTSGLTKTVEKEEEEKQEESSTSNK